MIRIQTLYKDQTTMKDFLDQSGFHQDLQCLIRIYTAICAKEQAICIAREIKELLPNAKVIGCSGSGIIYCGKQYEEETLIIAEQSLDSNVLSFTYSFENQNSSSLAEQVFRDFQSESAASIHVLCGDHYYDINNFINDFNQHTDSIRMVGGVAGDILSKNITGYVFTDAGVIQQGIVAAAICGKSINTFHAANISHTPISPNYTLDKTDGGIISQINGKPANEWCQEQFGMEDLTEYTDWQLIAENDALIRFPLILEGHGGASRFIKFNQDVQKMSLYFSQLDQNTRFRIGYTSPIACIQECFEICNALTKTTVESLFCYSCLFRKLYLGNCAEWELRPFLKANICGVFMMGEIGFLNGRNEFLNGSCSMIGIADHDVYVEPDFTVFDDLYKIKDDNQKLVNYVLQKQGTAMSKENEELLQKLMLQQDKENDKLYFDQTTGLANSFKYAQDNLIYNFDKMCMINIENYDLLVAVLGQAGYCKVLEMIVQEIRDFLKTSPYSDKLFYYILNNSTLFMTASETLSDTQFIEIANDYFSRYQIIKLPQNNDLMVNRFVLILHQEDLLAGGLRTLHKCKNLQTRFVISNDSLLETPELNQEMQMIHILNDVVSQCRVIPYFQGIFNNRTNRIDKFEALMRIEDIEGTIYLPGDFLPIAKKYHMYGALSRLMLEQVFKLFAGRSETVGVNLSASDINDDEMQNFIFSQLEKYEKVNNIVFELLEDESFRDLKKLHPFIERIRSYGISIAIDDFGSGYSNFMQILRINPDYIKIDMSIVRHIDDNVLSQKVVENISFLGKQLDALLVAEGVEKQSVQDKLELMDIHFSQGFLFSRPMPFQDLPLN